MKKGWKRLKFRDLGQIFNGNSISESEKKAHYTGIKDGVPYVGTKDVGFDARIQYDSGIRIPSSFQNRFKLAPTNSVLICAEGGSAGRKIAHTTSPVFFGNKLFAICPGPETNSRFVFYYCHCNDFTIAFRDSMSGLIGGVSLNKFKELRIDIPSLAEQRRIAGVLDKAFTALDKAGANTEKTLQNARALFESHLQSVFTRRGKGWVAKLLEEVLITQPQNGWSPPSANHSDLGTPVLTLSSVTGFTFRPEKIKFTSAVTVPEARYWVQNGDLLITRSNTPDLVGHVAIASGIQDPTIFPDLIMRMKPDPAKAYPGFLYYQMRTASLRKEISGRAQGASPTMKKISNKAVRTLPIFVPSLSDQRSIMFQLDALSAETERLVRLYQQKKAALTELKKSLLHQAFAGKL